MSQKKMNRAWYSKPERSGSLNLDGVDAFVLNPRSSHELVQRLSANSTWKIKCNAPDLVIIVRSGS